MRPSLAATFVATLALGSASVACGGTPEDALAEATGQVRSPIVDGLLSTKAQDSVVLIGVLNGGVMESACTGSLIAKNLILTARHCVADIDEPNGKVLGDRPANTLAIYTGVDAFPRADKGEAPLAKGARLFVTKGDALFPTDVALILLDKPINGTVMPIRLTSGGVVGEAITAVGYGRVEGGPISASRLQRTDLSITRNGPTSLPLGNSIEAGEFTLGESTCSGDSGGPSISSKTGAVIGVLSRVGNGVAPTAANPAAFCVGANTVAIYTSLASVKPTVDEAFAAAGAKPLLEGQSTTAAPISDGETESAAAKKDEEEEPPASPKSRRISAAPVESSGCSTGGTPSSASGVGLVLLALVTASARRRRHT